MTRTRQTNTGSEGEAQSPGTEDATGVGIEPDAETESFPRPSGVRQSVRDVDFGIPTDAVLPSPECVLASVLALSRKVSAEMHDEEIVRDHVETLQALFPRRLLAVRLVASENGRLSLVQATGRMLDTRRDAPEITRQALELHGISLDASSHVGFDVVPRYEALFAQGAPGFDVPILDGSQLVGVLDVEYPPGTEPTAGDRPIIAQLALQLGSALRNARLLRESRYLRDYLGQVLEHANAPIIVIGRKRDIRVVNRAFLSLTGSARADLLGRDFVKMIREEDRPGLLAVLIDALRGESTANHEVRVMGAQGGFARLALNTASIMSADGQVEAVIAIGRDVTEVRELEEQIIQAEKLATLGHLAAGVVHELNNPLTSISVYSDYLLKKYYAAGAEPGDVEKLRRIVQSADRILRFTRDLVTYARPSSEEPRPLDLHEVLDQSLVFCEHVIADSGSRIEKKYAPELPLVYGVKSQLHQVFINLITNACHAMPQGAGHLVVTTSLEGDDHLVVRVRDNGVGIPPDQLESIFQPFFSTKGEGKGTGLGLSIARNIVQQHSGRITVESRLGDGTSLLVLLPCRRQD